MASDHNEYKLDKEQKKTLKAAFTELDKYNDQIGEKREDMKAIWASLKDQGFNVKAAKKVYAERRRRESIGAEKYDEEQGVLDLYMTAMGLVI